MKRDTLKQNALKKSRIAPENSKFALINSKFLVGSLILTASLEYFYSANAQDKNYQERIEYSKYAAGARTEFLGGFKYCDKILDGLRKLETKISNGKT